MYTISHDYYAILGVVKDAAPEEIKGQYKRLMKEHHPDQYNGLKAKYEQGSDEALLKILGEKIKEAEEFCKLLNEAFVVLSDPLKRKQYDEQTVESKVEEPKISVSPKTISFGTLKDGEKKSSTFTIKNDGGPAASVNIDWEGTKPDWGDLIIEPDENNVFPIKITVAVNTTGIPSGSKDEKILVSVDGKTHLVEVFLAVVAIQRVAIPPASVATPVGGPVSVLTGPWRKWLPIGLAIVMVFGCLVIFFAGSLTQIQSQRATDQAVRQQATAEAHAEATATQRAVVTQQAFRESEVEAKSLVQVKDVVLLTEGQVMPNGSSMAYGIQPNKISFIQFTVVNSSKLTVGVSLPGCFPTSSIDGYWPNGYIGFFDKYEPGVEKSVTCWLSWVDGQDTPETYCVPEIEIWNDPYYTWHICPYRE